MKCSYPLQELVVGIRRSPDLCLLATRRPRRGFTIIELLAVVAVIAILAALTIATLGQVNRKGAESRAQTEVAALATAIEAYKIDTGNYPPDAASLYDALCATAPGSKVYFEARPQMVDTNSTPRVFIDPWATPYVYSNYSTYFEIWSTANSDNPDLFIRN